MSVPPKARAPILTAVYLEIAPVLIGKGLDGELAKLIEDSADLHKTVLVDETSDPGRAFLLARPYHIRKGYELAARLYASVGDKAGVQRVLDKLSKEFGQQIRG
jgi:hypothetical protein